MGKLENQWLSSPTRRTALRSLVTSFVAGTPLLRGQQDPFRDHSRVPAMKELVNAFDFRGGRVREVTRGMRMTTQLLEWKTSSRSDVTGRYHLEWVELIPKGIVDANSVVTATEVLGTPMAYPIMIAPTASHLSLHPEGELGTHKGATAASNTPFIISNNASLPVDKIAKAAAGPIWFQLYPKETLADNQQLIDVAQDNGCKAIVLTYDGAAGSSATGPRERALHDRHLESNRLEQDASNGGDKSRIAVETRRTRRPRKYGLTGSGAGLDWKWVDSVRAVTKVPFLTKGILTGEDAAACVEHGVNGIVVSNHGGRAMDYGPATLEVLAEVVDGTKGRIPVLVDGGFRRGTDVLKALALGAKAVCLGRVPRWGLASLRAAGITAHP